MATMTQQQDRLHQGVGSDEELSPDRFCQNFNDIITVLVGPEEHSFAIHKGLICAKSKFFHAACSKLWAEGKEKLVKLPEVTVDAFKTYIVWVYQDRVAVNSSMTRGFPSDKRENEQERITQLYLLGDYLDDMQVHNEAMKTLVSRQKVWCKQLSAQVLHQVWNATPPSSLLREMLTTVTIMRFDRDHFAEDSLEYPKELLHAIAVSLMHQTPVKWPEEFEGTLENYLEPSKAEDSQT